MVQLLGLLFFVLQGLDRRILAVQKWPFQSPADQQTLSFAEICAPVHQIPPTKVIAARIKNCEFK
jgi:hypothetical protein